MSSGIEVEQVEVDFLLLADKVEVLNGKLYMMGGAWDRRYISNIAAPIDVSMALGVLVPWNLTNEPHSLRIRLEDEDGNVVPPEVAVGNVAPQEVTVSVNVGRPTNSTRGQQFRAMVALTARWMLPKFGTYRIVVLLEGRDKKSTTFYAVERQAQAAPPPQR